MKAKKGPVTSDLYIWNGISAIFFSSCITPLHSHNTLQLIFDIQKDFRFRVINGIWKSYKNLVIKENVVHQLDTKNSVQLIVYLDPQTTVAKQISARYPNNDIYAPDLNLFNFIKPGELQKALLNMDADLLKKSIEKIIAGLTASTGNIRSDQRILKVEEVIATEHPGVINTKYLANKVCISESRLRALFKVTTGMPLYRYILWNKIRYATNCLMAGCAVNQAALEAGFADSSHFHKLMINMFGISPSQFINDNKKFNVIKQGEFPLTIETIVCD